MDPDVRLSWHKRFSEYAYNDGKATLATPLSAPPLHFMPLTFFSTFFGRQPHPARESPAFWRPLRKLASRNVRTLLFEAAAHSRPRVSLQVGGVCFNFIISRNVCLVQDG